jgi:hypothetical protein
MIASWPSRVTWLEPEAAPAELIQILAPADSELVEEVTVTRDPIADQGVRAGDIGADAGLTVASRRLASSRI